jgi:hypothetical protein
MKRLLASLLLVAGCKNAGTITLELIPESEPSCGQTHAIVFAEKTTCSSCSCGACLGIKPGSVEDPTCTVDDQCQLDDLSGASLALSPGQWAVVVDLLDATNHVIGYECVDVEVDVDGVADKLVTGDGFVCCSGALIRDLDREASDRVHGAHAATAVELEEQ